MTIGAFAEPSADDPDDAEETPPEPSVVDVRVWYELIGQKVLEELITDLNANGHSMLTIRENGDIVVSCQKKKVLKATLDSFPGKAYWKELVSILEENELNGKISDDRSAGFMDLKIKITERRMNELWQKYNYLQTGHGRSVFLSLSTNRQV